MTLICVRRFAACVLFIALLLSAPLRAAQQTPPAPEPQAQVAQPAEPSESPPAPLNKPKYLYLGLRYNEDFSYLDGPPGSYEPDYFDAIKNISLTPDWKLSIGGSFRFRMEAETDKAFGAAARGQDTFQLYQYMIHFDFKYQDSFRVFVQGIQANDEERDLAPRGIDENHFDAQQLFADFKLTDGPSPLTLRVGRQEILHGKERLISPLAWANVRRRFDGVKLFSRTDTWNLDLWYLKPVGVERNGADDWVNDVHFYGAYATYKGIPNHGLDLYALGLSNKGNAMNPNFRRGDMTVFTVGGRLWGTNGNFDYEAEVAGQWGKWAGDTVQAWMFALDGGYTFKELEWKPRIGAGYDWASGDENPLDGKVGTFNQLFPLGHKYFGFLDLVGRQNINSVNLNVSAWPLPGKVQTRLAWMGFWLDADRDALYNAGGRATRRDITGSSGQNVGHELDWTVKWITDTHSSVLLGWSHLFEGSFIQRTGFSDDPDLFYIQYAFTF